MMFHRPLLLLITAATSSAYDLRAGDTTYWCTNCDGPALADALLTYQRPSGGWPKNIDPQPGDEYTGTEEYGCLDNGATVGEIRFMAQAYKETSNNIYLNSAQDGLDFIFNSQFPTGGWPQYIPLQGGYKDAITFNDNLHINVMQLLDELAATVPPFDISPFTEETRSSNAIEMGIQCILVTQIQMVDPSGICPSRVSWCAQHDNDTLEPIPGRDYEPASFSGKEGMKIAEYLMNLDDPSPDVKDAIVGAYIWAKKGVLLNYVKERDANNNKILVYSEGAELWPRFARIPDSTVIFCDRGCVNDGALMYNEYPVGYSQMDPERRNGYTWLGSWGQAVITKFETEWSTIHQPNFNADCLTSTFPPTLQPTPQPISSTQCPDGCFDRCLQKHGGTINSGDSYYCAKGCAGMSGGQIANPDKYCSMEPSSRYDSCITGCDSASSNEANRVYCRFGCEYWNLFLSSTTTTSTSTSTTSSSTTPATTTTTSFTIATSTSMSTTSSSTTPATTTTAVATTPTTTTTTATTGPGTCSNDSTRSCSVDADCKCRRMLRNPKEARHLQPSCTKDSDCVSGYTCSGSGKDKSCTLPATTTTVATMTSAAPCGCNLPQTTSSTIAGPPCSSFGNRNECEINGCVCTRSSGGCGGCTDPL